MILELLHPKYLLNWRKSCWAINLVWSKNHFGLCFFVLKVEQKKKFVMIKTDLVKITNVSLLSNLVFYSSVVTEHLVCVKIHHHIMTIASTETWFNATLNLYPSFPILYQYLASHTFHLPPDWVEHQLSSFQWAI